jgi:hypothetical protein
MINNTDLVIGITFEDNPEDSGYINCNQRKFLNGDYVRYNMNMSLDCLAVPKCRLLIQLLVWRPNFETNTFEPDNS